MNVRLPKRTLPLRAALLAVLLAAGIGGLGAQELPPVPTAVEEAPAEAEFTPEKPKTDVVEKPESPAKPGPKSDVLVPRRVPRQATGKDGVPPVTGPIFRIPGAEAVVAARAKGYKFSPAGGIGPRDGLHTQAKQVPGVVTSEVDGVRMMQLRPAAGWAIPQTSNTFYMFTDASLKPAPQAKGWRLRGIRLKGPNWMWAGQPKSGAPSASFALTLVAFRNNLPATIVTLETLILEGPEGATDWRQAFALPAAAP